MTALLIGSEELTERWNGRKSATVVFAVSLVVLGQFGQGGHYCSRHFARRRCAVYHAGFS